VIHRNFKDPKRNELTKKLLNERREILRGVLAKHDFDSGVWKNAKVQLLRETFDKCAYCESPTATVAYGDVEHYRPKSIYWWLAYSLENYLASCAICNQKFKRDKFPKSGSKMKGPRIRRNTSAQTIDRMAKDSVPDSLSRRSVQDFLRAHNSEIPLLINPYMADPALAFAYRADDVLREVEIIPRSNSPDAPLFVKAAEDVYGLNRSELKRSRFFIFESYKTHRETLNDRRISTATRRNVTRTIGNMKKSERPFSGMIRYFESIGGP
jgi:hypothetical protein